MQIIIDTSHIKKTFGDLPKEIEIEILIEMKEQLTQIQRLARINHRHITRTTMLNQSIQTEIHGQTGEVGFDPSIADYGKYVHEGHGTWAPDRFIDQAVEQREPEIISGFERAINKGISKVTSI